MSAVKYASLNRVTAASVKKGSGKDWDEWVRLLDEAGARVWTHQRIVAYLRQKHRQGPWWQQGVASGYTVAIGRRAEGATLKGEYTLTCTKTVPVDPEAAWRALLSDAGLAIWLKPLSPVRLKQGAAFETEDGAFGEVRTFEKAKRIRLRWQDPEWLRPSTFQLQLFPRAGGKSLVVFSHLGLATPAIKARLRERWRHGIDEFAASLAVKPSPRRKARRGKVPSATSKSTSR